MQYYIDFLRTPFETYAVNGAGGAGGDFDNATTTTHPFPIKAPTLGNGLRFGPAQYERQRQQLPTLASLRTGGPHAIPNTTQATTTTIPG